MFSNIADILTRSGNLLLELLPYVVLGVFLAEALKYTPWTKFVKDAISKSPISSILVSTILGIFSPMCTYGTIPIVINLHQGGVPLAPLLTFLAASSLMNPQLFMITWGGLGANIAIIRLISIILFSLLLGYSIDFIEKKHGSLIQQKVNQRFTRTCSTEKNWRQFKIKEFLKNSYSNFEFVGFYIVIGILVSMILETFVPVSILLERASNFEWVNILLASIISIPMYVCGGGIIPFVNMLIDNGMSIGAVIAFLIVGPATRITPLMALGSFLSKQMLAIYVIALILFSFVLGLILNFIF